MKTANIAEAKAHFATLLAEVEAGEDSDHHASRHDAAGRTAALAAFNRLSDSLILAEVEPGDFRVAVVLLDMPALALRAGGAVIERGEQ